MPKTEDKAKASQDLRERAEKLLGHDTQHIKTISPEEVKDLVQELHVHQIELELQNEELRRAQQELEATRTKYYELYDFAPVGYFSLDQKKFIREANLAGSRLLGVARSFLIGTPFANYIAQESFEEFYNHIRDVFETNTKQYCELKLSQKGKEDRFIAMESIALWDEAGKFTRCLSTISDITKRVKVEHDLQKSHLELESKVQERTRDLAKSKEKLQEEITERMHFEASVRASEARYRYLFASTPVSIWEEDFTEIGKWLEKLRADGVRNLRKYLKVQPDALKEAVKRIRILNINEATLEMLEAESKEELMANFESLFTKETYEAVAEELVAVWEGRQRFKFELSARTLKGNRVHWVLHWFVPRRSGRLDLSRVILAFTDITSLKKAHDELHFVFNVSQAIQKADNFSSAVGTALSEICRSTAWDYGEVWLPDENGMLEYGSSWCLDSEALKKFSQVSQKVSLRKQNEGLPGRVWTTKKAEWMEDISSESSKAFKRVEPATRAGLSTALGVPLIDKGEILAVLVFFTFARRQKDDQLIELISTVAMQLGEFLQRKKAETALGESEARYRGLVESSPDAIFVEQEESVVFMNSAALRLLGYNAPTEVNGSLVDLFCDNTHRSLEKLLKHKKNFPASQVEGELLHQNGHSIAVEASFIRTTYRDKPAILAQVRDIREKKALQEKNKRMERLATMGEISANIAHEIRNPLGVIRLNCNYLEGRLEIPEKAQERLSDLKQSITRIEKIVDSIMGFAKPRKPQLAELDLHAVLDASLNMVKSDLKQSEIRIIKNYKAQRVKLTGDEDQITQVFINLFANAIDAMQPGGKLTIATATDDDEMQVLVKDTGEGIPEEMIDKIFDPFFTTKETGTGLGMAIVERILKNHKAGVTVESEVGKGTEFCIRFPLAGKQK